MCIEGGYAAVLEKGAADALNEQPMRSKTKKTTDAVVGNHIGWHIHYLCLLLRGQSSRCLCLLPVVEEGEVVE